MRMTSFIKTPRWISGGLIMVGLCSIASAAIPEISWDPVQYQPFPNNAWYQSVRALAHDSDGDLMAVRVDYMDNNNQWQHFAWNGGGNGTSATSDLNFADGRPDGRARVFRAWAVDQAGHSSNYIYLMVKPFGTSFTVDDLLPQGSDSGNYFFPNANSAQINSLVYTGVINSLQNRGSITIWFLNEVYDFDTNAATGKTTRNIIKDATTVYDASTWNNVNSSETEAGKVEKVGDSYYHYSGKLADLDHASNITFKAVTRRAAVIRWAGFSTGGALSLPADHDIFLPSYLTVEGNDTQTAANIAAYTQKYRGTGPGSKVRAWPQPGPFLWIRDTCSNITFDGIVFTTLYDLKDVNTRSDTANHISNHCTNAYFDYCNFSLSPGFAFVSTGSNVHINAGYFYLCSGDGINIDSGDNVWVVGNALYGTGDDAIAIKGSNVHVLSNDIQQSGWRGIFVTSTDGGEVRDNHITSCADHGIEFSEQFGAVKNIAVSNNIISGVGSWPKHNLGNIYQDNTIGIRLGATSGLQLENNQIAYYDGSSGGYANRWGISYKAGGTTDQSVSGLLSSNPNITSFPTGTAVSTE